MGDDSTLFGIDDKNIELKNGSLYFLNVIDIKALEKLKKICDHNPEDVRVKETYNKALSMSIDCIPYFEFENGKALLTTPT